MSPDRILTHEEARRFYDRFGSWQDLQRFYEDPAIDVLLRYARFANARHVIEFGCGTGRVAARLLRDCLPSDATYAGFDLSETMVGLARARVAAWSERATVTRVSGDPCLPLPDADCDRFLSTYVLDLLATEEIQAVLREAERILAPGGLLCLVSLSSGRSFLERRISALWRRIHEARPALLGGCRPIDLEAHLSPRWELVHREIVCRLGLCSETLVAARGRSAGPPESNAASRPS